MMEKISSAPGSTVCLQVMIFFPIWQIYEFTTLIEYLFTKFADSVDSDAVIMISIGYFFKMDDETLNENENKNGNEKYLEGKRRYGIIRDSIN